MKTGSRATPSKRLILGIVAAVVLAPFIAFALFLGSVALIFPFKPPAAVVIDASKPIDPNVTVKLVYSQPGPGWGFRILGSITNPHPYALAGVTTRWEAFDQAGNLVENGTRTHPPIPAGSELPFVGNGTATYRDTGMPSRIDISVIDSGQQASIESPVFDIEPVTLQTDYRSPTEGMRGSAPKRLYYQPIVTFSAPNHAIVPNDVIVGIIAKDQAGQIIGVQAVRPTDKNKIPPGTRTTAWAPDFKQRGEIATLEAWAYVQPPS